MEEHMSNKVTATGLGTTSTDNGNKKRPNESKFDPLKLRELIKAGKTAKEIMEYFKIGHKQILKHHVLRLCNMDNCYYNIPGLYNQNARKAYTNSKGAIIIKNSLIDWNGLILEPDKTVFDVEVDAINKKIILSVIEQIPVVPKQEIEDSRDSDEGIDAALQ